MQIMIAINFKYYLNLSAIFLRMQFCAETIKHTLGGYNLKKNFALFFRYILNSSEDAQDFHILLTNGSIFAREHNPKILQPGIDYCIEIIPEMGINTFVCFSEGEF